MEEAACVVIHCLFSGLVFCLLDLFKSHGDEAYNVSRRRHKPFICIQQIRGGHFIRHWGLSRQHAPSAFQKCRAGLTWQLCQLCRAPELTNTPEGLQCIFDWWRCSQSPRCDLLCNLTSMEQNCNGSFCGEFPRRGVLLYGAGLDARQRQSSHRERSQSYVWVMDVRWLQIC